MPIIRARSSSISGSIDLRGTPTAPTAAQTVHTTQVATTAYVGTAVTNLINSAPTLLDTLSELAAAINNDESYASTVTTALAGKVAKAGDTMTGLLTLSGDPTANLHATTKQYVDQLINAQMIYSTDDVPEGSLNLYYTDARVRGAWHLTSNNTSVLDYDSTSGTLTYSHPTSDGILEGQTNQYFTQSRARGSVSLTSDDSQILSYSNTTGAFTWTTPNSDKIVEGASNQYFTTARARSSVSNGANIDYDSATGIISTKSAVWSVNTQTHDVVLDTDDINEGSTNLYFTNARARSAVSLTTDDSNILGYNSTSGIFTWVTPSTDAIDEGTNNLYYTDARVRSAISAAGWTNLSYSNTTGVITITAPTTDDVTEGTGNLYFTNTRARNSVSATDAGGDGSFTYDSATGAFTYTGPSDSEVRAHFSAGTTGTGYGDLTYAAGVYTYAKVTDANIRGAISATSASGVSYDSTMGVISLASIPNASLTNSKVTVNSHDISLGGSYTLDADDIAEKVGGTNKYWTQTRFDTAFSGKTTDNLTEGSNNVYYTNTRARGAMAAGTGVTYTAATGTIAIGQAVETTSDVAFNNMTLAGNLTVNGTVTAVNSTTVDIADKNLTLAKGAANAAAANGAGLTIDGASATFNYVSTPDRWETNKGLYVNGNFGTSGNASFGAIDNTPIGATTPSTGKFTTLTDTALTAGRVTFAGTGGALSDDAGLTFATGILTSTAGFNGALTGNVTGNLTGDVTGKVSDISNHTTTELAEGTNLYFTDTRARAALSGSATGTGHGDFAYNSTTGAFTYTKVTSAEVRGDLSATTSTGAAYDSATGVISLANIPNASLTNSKVTINTKDVSLGGSLTLGTDDVNEGTTNLYFTQARARLAVSLTTSKNTVLSYDNTTGVFNFNLANLKTDDVAEGTTNLYFTTARARASVSNGTNIDYDSTSGVISTQAAVWSVNGKNHAVVIGTDDVNEGSTNLYFTNARARSAFSLTSDDTNILSFNSSTGVITFAKPTTDAISEGANNLYWTNTRFDDRIGTTSVNQLSDVDTSGGLSDGFALVWSSAQQNFVPQNVATQSTSLNFTGDGTTTSFSTGVKVATIDNTQVYINGLIQAPTYSYTINTVNDITSIVITEAPEQDDYIFIRVSAVAQLSAGGVLNEASTIDGGTF